MPRTDHGLPGIYNLSPITLADGNGAALALDSQGRVKVAADINTGDIEIGAVEIKNGATDDRLSVVLEDAASTGGEGMILLGAVRQDTVSSSTSTDGDYGYLKGDSVGNLRTREYLAPTSEDNTNGVIGTIDKPVAASTYSGSWANSFATATKLNAKATGGTALSATASNSNAAVRYFQVHNKASAPAGTEVPIISIPIPAGTAAAPGQLILPKSFFQNYFFSTGVGWAISTTSATFTDSATASEHIVNFQYF